MPQEADLLAVRTPARAERADAARNRRAVLDAAAILFRERGAESVTMDEVAAKAGVGKGTLFRRFGDKSGLAMAVLDEAERDLQERILSGPPPLGPGAAPGPRLVAFAGAYLDFLLANLDVVRMSEAASPGARYRVGAYRFWQLHARILLDGTPDPDFAAHALLASLSAVHVSALLAEIGEDRVREGVARLARSLFLRS
ncbi:helix-turn-helix domain-containing protein [Hamadaea sp. NPDC050747]|uniref:TetR/AcrR family transcriptional regulator n=1 Tax=Hamadaea sp. NPDC050747 TaxID=3155789 RepID=UPI0033CA4EF5